MIPLVGLLLFFYLVFKGFEIFQIAYSSTEQKTGALIIGVLAIGAPFRLYDCRHTWATRMAMAGVDLVTLAALLGHSRIQMVLRYAHPTEHHQFAAMQKRRRFMAS